MTREDAIPYVAYVVDDAGCGRPLGADMHAAVRPGNRGRLLTDTRTDPDSLCYPSRLVGWQCGFEPLFVAVHSYLDVKVADDDAEDMAREYLEEIDWFAGEPRSADYIL